MSKQKMSVERHIKNANDLAKVKHYLIKIVNRCNKCFPKSSRLMKQLNKINPGNVNSYFSDFIYELDEEYHEIASKNDLEKHGNIYCNLDELFKLNFKKGKKNE